MFRVIIFDEVGWDIPKSLERLQSNNNIEDIHDKEGNTHQVNPFDCIVSVLNLYL